MAMLDNPWFSPLDSGFADVGMRSSEPPLAPPEEPWADPLAEMVEKEATEWLGRVKGRFEKHLWPVEDELGLRRSELPPVPTPGELHNRRQTAELRAERHARRMERIRATEEQTRAFNEAIRQIIAPRGKISRIPLTGGKK
jgi:hypothetical protein